MPPTETGRGPGPGPDVIGIDLGGTNVNVALVAADGTILDREHATTPIGDPDAAVTVIAERIGRIADRAEPARRPRAVGIAAAGAIDMPRGVILEAPNLRWRDVPLRDALARATGLPVVLENDVNGAAWGEHRARVAAGRGAEDGSLMAAWVGTGVGGGIVLGGRVLHGDRHTAGELGHVIVRPGAPRGRRTVEDLCSRSGLQRRVADGLADGSVNSAGPLGVAVRTATAEDARAAQPDTRVLAAAWTAGDPDAVRLLGEAADLLGIAIAGCVTLLSLPAVVLGGGMVEALDDAWMDRVRDAFRDAVFPAQLADVPLEVTRLRDLAGMLGAADLARRMLTE
jgi:glucokinase